MIIIHKLETQQEKNLLTITKSISSEIDRIKFALFATKDCLHLSDENSKPLVERCIQLVESRLNNPQSVTRQQLKEATKSIADYTKIYHPAHVPADYYVGRSAVVTAIYTDAYESAYNAANAFYVDNKNAYYNKNIQYRNYAYSLLRTTNIVPTNTKGKISDKATLMALLDELSDLNEDLILYQDNKVVLNHPAYPVTTTLPELVNLIWNDSSLLHYLEHLYGNQIT